jgi:hypothetical protein
LYKASVMLKEHLKFRLQYQPHAITEKQVQKFEESGFWTTVGFTKENHPLELIIAKKFQPQKFQGDELIQALIFQREKIAKMIQEKREAPAVQETDTDEHHSNEFMLRERTLLLIDASGFSFTSQVWLLCELNLFFTRLLSPKTFTLPLFFSFCTFFHGCG